MGNCLHVQRSSGTNVMNKNGSQSVSGEDQSVPRENQLVSRENQRVPSENQLASRENQSVSTESQLVFREDRREARFKSFEPSITFKIFNDSRLEGGIALIYDWRKRNVTLSNNEILTQAANGILVEGDLLNKYKEAEYLAKNLLDMQDKSEKMILIRCIYFYTMDTFLYKLVNSVLRENDKTKVDTIAPFCYFLTEAIWSDTLADERFYGIVYRGIDIPSKAIGYYEELIGKHKCWYGFTSTSKDRGPAERFGNSLFIIDITRTGGLTISKYSEFPDEDEVILPPGTIFRIDKVVQEHNKTYIYIFVVPEFRVILLGRTGSGKSSFGNAILEKKNQFKSLKTAKSVTKKCEVHDRIFHDIRLLVVDTPGFFDTELKPKDLIPEIYSSYQVAAPGPHAFFVVFTTDRFTIQEQTVAEWIYKVFDERALDYCIIVFTGLDGLEKNNQTIEEFLQDAPEFLTNLIQKCNGRYIAIDNTASDDKIEEKSKILLEKISMMVKKNGGQYYNNKSFIQIADVLKKYPDWFDPVKSDGTVNLVEETANIVARELNANAIFKNQ